MKIEVSNGEIVDKVTILLIKSKKITDSSKLRNVEIELNELYPALIIIGVDNNHQLFKKLYDINSKLWEVEDILRDMEHRGIFNQDFIYNARQVYHLNDERASIKKEINIITKSMLIEEKSYIGY